MQTIFSVFRQSRVAISAGAVLESVCVCRCVCMYVCERVSLCELRSAAKPVQLRYYQLSSSLVPSGTR